MDDDEALEQTLVVAGIGVAAQGPGWPSMGRNCQARDRLPDPAVDVDEGVERGDGLVWIAFAGALAVERVRNVLALPVSVRAKRCPPSR